MDNRQIAVEGQDHTHHENCGCPGAGMALEDQILKELLALPPAVLDRLVFRKVQLLLKSYRKYLGV